MWIHRRQSIDAVVINAHDICLSVQGLNSMN